MGVPGAILRVFGSSREGPGGLGGSRGNSVGPQVAPGGLPTEKEAVLDHHKIDQGRPTVKKGVRTLKTACFSKLYCFRLVVWGWIQMGSREVQVGSEKGGRRPCGLPGSPRASGSGPLGAFWGGPGFAREGYGFNFEGKT